MTCDFLDDARGDEACGDHTDRCAQMQSDGSRRVVECVVSSYYRNARGESVEILPDEVEQRVQCIAELLTARGADRVREEADRVRARADWAALAALARASALVCQPVCDEESCSYCAELDEGECEADAFCSAGFGQPVDIEAQCLEPSRFATCRAGDAGCDDALTTAYDAAGQCWSFGSICYDEGFDYEVADPACSYEVPECAE